MLKNLPLKLVVVQCGQKYEISVHDINALPDQDKMPSLQKELQDIGKSLFSKISPDVNFFKARIWEKIFFL